MVSDVALDDLRR